MTQRKAQMEIFGLMIVVILLIIGVLFAVKFVVLKKPPEVKESFSRTQLASNLGLTLMDTNTKDCRGTALKDLMTDCAEWPEMDGTISCDDGTKSCEYAKNAIEQILNSTLNTWRVKYELKAGTSKKPEDQIFYFNNRECTDNVPGSSESFFLPTNRGLLTMKIFICN
ncbi:hypothetical protein ACFL0V_04815 [Nanoarchaeota archaeon]